MMESLRPKQSEARSMVSAEGAQWVRADFHLHIRVDREFKYTGDDNFYNSNYVDACFSGDRKMTASAECRKCRSPAVSDSWYFIWHSAVKYYAKH